MKSISTRIGLYQLTYVQKIMKSFRRQIISTSHERRRFDQLVRIYHQQLFTQKQKTRANFVTCHNEKFISDNTSRDNFDL